MKPLRTGLAFSINTEVNMNKCYVLHFTWRIIKLYLWKTFENSSQTLHIDNFVNIKYNKSNKCMIYEYTVGYAPMSTGFNTCNEILWIGHIMKGWLCIPVMKRKLVKRPVSLIALCAYHIIYNWLSGHRKFTKNCIRSSWSRFKHYSKSLFYPL